MTWSVFRRMGYKVSAVDHAILFYYDTLLLYYFTKIECLSILCCPLLLLFLQKATQQLHVRSTLLAFVMPHKTVGERKGDLLMSLASDILKIKC